MFRVLLLERYLVNGLYASILLQLIYTCFYGVLIILIYTHDISTLQLTSWASNIVKLVGGSLADAVNQAADREGWRALVMATAAH